MLLLLLPVAPVDGQVLTGSVAGYVTDMKGAPIEAAAVTILNTGNRQLWATATDSKGHYAFLQLMPATYDLSVKAEGRNPYEVHTVILHANQSAEYSPKLAALDASKQAARTAGRVYTDTQTANRSSTLNAGEITEPPTSLRNPLLLTHTTAGVTAITTGAIPANTADQFSSRLGLNGGRQNGSAILLDGIPMNSLGRGDVMVTPGLETVRELQIVHEAYDPQYGAANGSAINLITKSGSSAFHGSGFEFLRNDKLDANRWESNKYGVDRQPFHRNQYGGDVAGPVTGKESRFFFFAGYEGLTDSQPTLEVATVPTEAMKRGNFSAATVSGGTLLPIYNPFTTRLLAGANYARDIFPGNIIPARLINPAGTLAANLYPQANAPGTAGNNGQYVASSKVDSTNNREDGRLDWAPTDHLSLFGRGTRARQTANGPFYPNYIADQASGQSDPRYAFSGGAIWAPNAISTYSLLLGASHWSDNQTAASQNFDGIAVGLPAATVAQFQAPVTPQFSISNYQGLGGAANREYVSTNYYGELNGSRQYHQHSLKFGFAYQIQRWDPSDASSALFNFTNGLTSGATASVDTLTSGNAIASLLLGAGASGNASYVPSLGLSQNSYALYVHDTWHFNQRLTITGGIRYQVQGAPKESNNRLNNFDPAANSPLSASTALTLKGGLVFASSLWPTVTNNIAPQLGVAYKLTDAIVFRTGGGISFVPTSLSGLAASDGYSTNTTWVSTLGNAGFAPGYLLDNPFPNGLNAPVGSTEGLSTGVGEAINANLKSHPTGYVGNYSADFQIQLARNGGLDVGYVGAQGHKLAQGVDTNINQLDPTYLAKGPELNRLVTNPFSKGITTGPLSGSKVAAYQLLLPFGQFTSVMQSPLTPAANSSFNAFVIRYHYNLSRNMSVLAAYQWSKSMDNASESQAALINDAARNVYNLSGERSLSAHDVPKDLAINFVYALSLRRRGDSNALSKLAAPLLSGWQLSGVMRFASGLPLQFYAPNNLSTYGFAIQRPTITSLGLLTPILGKRPDKWFNTLYVRAPQVYTVGDMPRFEGVVRTGTITNVDLSISRNWVITESLRLQVRAEAFNVNNTPQFGRANTTMGSAGFGTVTDTFGNPRNLQLGVRLDF